MPFTKQSKLKIESIDLFRKPLYMKIKGELEIETRLPTSAIPRISMRLKVGNNYELEDVSVDHRCSSQS